MKDNVKKDEQSTENVEDREEQISEPELEAHSSTSLDSSESSSRSSHLESSSSSSS